MSVITPKPEPNLSKSRSALLSATRPCKGRNELKSNPSRAAFKGKALICTTLTSPTKAKSL